MHGGAHSFDRSDQSPYLHIKHFEYCKIFYGCVSPCAPILMWAVLGGPQLPDSLALHNLILSGPECFYPLGFHLMGRVIQKHQEGVH
jgi:hypothetical protein